MTSFRFPPLRRAAAALALCASALACSASNAQPVKTDHVTAELVAERSAVRAGEALQIGLRLLHAPHWHTYWRNPGDSGLPTALDWQLPAGAAAGEIEWPAPVRLPIGPLVNYGYEGDLLLPLRFTAPAAARPGTTLTVKAQATWLVCKDVCIPENAALELRLPVVDPATEPGTTADTARFASAAAQSPTPLPGWQAELQQAGRDLLFTLTRPASAGGGAPLPPIDVFPYAEQLIEPARQEVFRTPRGYAVRLALLEGAQLPDRFTGVVVARGAAAPPWSGQRTAAEFSASARAVAAIALPAGAVKLEPAPSAGSTGSATAGEANRPAASGTGADIGLLAALALAFVGGIVLNLMPCVFPVLSIKLLSLAQQSGGSRAELRRHALFYGAGVVSTFVALAAVLLALRAAGGAVGWGFQLQEPGVVFALALLFFALGLNLVGAFEFGNLVPQPLLSMRARQPAVDALASGVLAVLAASPCTAPFMGAALGFALTQPPLVGLAVFATLGLGMALPYAALVLWPGWRSRLPRPGSWMLRLKQALAFPLFATVVWLVWVLGLQAGVDGVAKALLALVAAAFGIWAAGVLAGLRTSAWARRFGGGAIVLAVLAALAWSWPLTPGMAGDAGRTVSIGSTAAGSRDAMAAADGQPAWRPYDETELARQVAAGTPVFVDFTAAWCVSCQVNKRLVLHRDETMAAFARANVALMRADWTLRDARITAALARLGRNGVPVYVLMRPGREPLLLPEILTARVVRDALSTL